MPYIKPGPVYYVYIWRHDGVACYVGMASGSRRWRDHLKNDAGRPEKSAYFRQHRHEMKCEKVVEGITWAEGSVIEEKFCRQFGLLCDGTGTLFNRTYTGAQAAWSQASRASNRAAHKARCNAPGYINPATLPEVRAKISAAMNAPGRVNPATLPEVRAKNSAAQKMRSNAPGYVNPAKRPEVRAKISAANPMKRPEVRAKISAARIAYWAKRREQTLGQGS
jgi:hypothetical protein